MKKALFFVAAAALTTGTLVSCGKTSKGKLDGEWTVDNYESVTTNTSGSNTMTETTKASGSVYSETTTFGNSTDTETGVLNSHTWSMKKDGTWERKISYTFTETVGSTTHVEKIETTESGNWDFLNGVGEFKKNERIVFNTMKSVKVTTNTIGSNTTTTTNTDTFLDGETSAIFVVTESSKKALSLEASGATTDSSTSGSTTTTSSGTTKVTYTLSAN